MNELKWSSVCFNPIDPDISYTQAKYIVQYFFPEKFAVRFKFSAQHKFSFPLFFLLYPLADSIQLFHLIASHSNTCRKFEKQISISESDLIWQIHFISFKINLYIRFGTANSIFQLNICEFQCTFMSPCTLLAQSFSVVLFVTYLHYISFKFSIVAKKEYHV